MVSAQVESLETESDRGAEMVAGLLACEDEGKAAVCVQIISPLCTLPGLFLFFFQTSLTIFLLFYMAGILRPTRVSLLHKGCWLWPGHCSAARRTQVLSKERLVLLQRQGPGTKEPAQNA